MTKNSSVKGIT